MAKGIIVVNMPDKCWNCEMRFFNEYYDEYECYFRPGEEIKPDDEKPEWCPIKELPERKNAENANNPKETLNTVLDAGWNACLNEIDKESAT